MASRNLSPRTGGTLPPEVTLTLIGLELRSGIRGELLTLNSGPTGTEP